MAEFTMSILELLQQSGLELSTTANVTAAAKSEIFRDLLDYIKPEYRDLFASGFAYHFLDDELAYPTVTRWRMALAEKMINGGAFVNEIYDKLDRQIFSVYEVTKSENQSEQNAGGSETDTLTRDMTTKTDATDTLETSRKDEKTRTNENSTTRTDDLTDTINGTLKRTGTETDNATENTTNKQTGTLEREKSDTTTYNTTENLNGTDTLTRNLQNKTQYDTDIFTRSETTEVTNTKESQDNNTETKQPTESRVTRDPSALTESVEDNSITRDAYSDTPQNGLAGVENNTYLTNYRKIEKNGPTTTSYSGQEVTTTELVTPEVTATEGTAHDESTQRTQHVRGNITTGGIDDNDGLEHKRGFDTVTMTGTDTNAKDMRKTHSGTDKVAGTDTETRNLTDTITGTKGNTKELDTTDTNKATNSHTGTQATTGTGSETENATITGTDTKTNDGTSKTTGTDTNEKRHENRTTATDNGETTHYTLTAEMLATAEPIISKVWRYFDDLFLIYIGGLY